MSKDEIAEAYWEWHMDAVKDSSRMPTRREAFYAGWQACMEWYENGGQSENTTEG